MRLSLHSNGPPRPWKVRWTQWKDALEQKRYERKRRQREGLERRIEITRAKLRLFNEVTQEIDAGSLSGEKRGEAARLITRKEKMQATFWMSGVLTVWIGGLTILFARSFGEEKLEQLLYSPWNVRVMTAGVVLLAFALTLFNLRTSSNWLLKTVRGMVEEKLGDLSKQQHRLIAQMQKRD